MTKGNLRCCGRAAGWLWARKGPKPQGMLGARPSEGPYNLNHVRIETRKGFGRRARPAFIAPYTESLVESGEEEEGWERAPAPAPARLAAEQRNRGAAVWVELACTILRQCAQCSMQEEGSWHAYCIMLNAQGKRQDLEMFVCSAARHSLRPRGPSAASGKNF